MTSTSLRLALLPLALALPLHAQEAPHIDGQQDAAGARVIINELNTDDYPDVRVIATILDEGGRPLTGLAAEDFRVREDEVDQTPLTVEPQLPPLSVVVTIDTSGSMNDAMPAAKEAAKAFTGSLGEGDAVQIVGFAEEVTPVTDMVTTSEGVDRGIDGLTARGDTALYDAVARSLDLLEGRRGRKAVVVLSDGVDDNGAGAPLSVATVDEVLARAGDLGVPIFAIGLGSEMDEAVLTAFADETGGIYLNAPDAGQLQAVYGTISDQLSGQYSIRYTSSLPADGTERRVDLDGPGGRDSRSYAPEGTAAASAPAPSAPPSALAAAGCAPLDRLTSVRGDLETAKQRYEDGLISGADRMKARKDAMDPVPGIIDANPPDYACAIEAMNALKSMYDEGLIDGAIRLEVRNALAAPLGDACAGEETMEGVIGCFELFGDAYDRGLIDGSTRQKLNQKAREPLLTQLRAMDDPDAALVRIKELYDRGLIDGANRTRLRNDVLAAE